MLRPCAMRITFRGAVEGYAKSRAFTDCDPFVQPIHSVNFCGVVAEALARSAPSITTVNSPLETMGAKGCGTAQRPRALRFWQPSPT